MPPNDYSIAANYSNLVMAELPANLKSQEFNLEVSERLRQLAIALKRNSSAQ